MQKLTTTQHGFTLLEVLVAIVILSFGLLGLAGLQAIGLKNNHSAYLRTQANTLANDIFERMRANREAALAGEYDLKMDDVAPSGNTAKTDLAQWLAGIRALPDGDGSVVVNTNGIASVVVRWDDSRGSSDYTADDDGNAGKHILSYRFQTQL